MEDRGVHDGLADPQTEAALVAAILLGGDAFERASAKVEPADLCEVGNKALMAGMKRLSDDGRPMDRTLVRAHAIEMLRARGLDPDEADRCLSIADRAQPTSAAVDDYADRIARLAELRRLKQESQRLIAAISSEADPATIAAQGVESFLSTAMRGAVARSTITYGQMHAEYQERLAEEIRLRQSGQMVGLTFGFAAFDDYTLGMRPEDGDCVILAGAPGCITGDAIVHINRAGKGKAMTLEHVYRQFNGIPIRKGVQGWDQNIPTYCRALVDGELRQHRVVDVKHSGVKRVIRLVFKSGKQLKCTPEHLIRTTEGWVEAQHLTPEHVVLGNGRHLDKNGYVILTGGQYAGHSRAVTKKNKGGTHRYELREHLLVMEKVIGRPVRLDEHVHHINEIKDDNRPENLQLMSAQDHLRLHGDHKQFHGAKNKHGQVMFVPCYETLESIEWLGVEQVYDICMEEPHNNFVANGIVVHNSGKTALAMHMLRRFALRQATEQHPITALFQSLEMGASSTAMRYTQMAAAVRSRELRTGQIDEARLRDIASKVNRESGIPLRVNFSSAMYGDQIKALIAHEVKTHNVRVVVIDHLRYFRMRKEPHDKNERDAERIHYIKEEICKRLGVAAIVIAHTRKGRENQDSYRPSMGDLMGSQMIAATVDGIAMVYRPWLHASDEEKAQGVYEETEAYLCWVKNRVETGGDARYLFDGALMRIEDHASYGVPADHDIGKMAAAGEALQLVKDDVW